MLNDLNVEYGRRLGGTPRQFGFGMPAEFGQHRQTWILWPERTDIWPFGAKRAQSAIVALAEIISRFEPVTVGVSIRQHANARARLPSDVRVIELSYNGCWIRDSGPVFLSNREEVSAVAWEFNAWGGLYTPWDLDSSMADRLLDVEDVRHWRSPYVLEGGAITVDGIGTLITTSECVLNANRNPNIKREELERAFLDYLGVKKTIWLPSGLTGDETGGHVDNLCFFARPGEVVLAWTEDPEHPQFHVVQEAREVLENSRDARGKQLRIHLIPFPSPQEVTHDEAQSIDLVPGTVPRPESMSLPGSYANCYFVNGGLVVPCFDDPVDDTAIRILAGVFPDREVVKFSSRDLLIGGGNVHCNVLQQPAEAVKRAPN